MLYLRKPTVQTRINVGIEHYNKVRYQIQKLAEISSSIEFVTVQVTCNCDKSFLPLTDIKDDIAACIENRGIPVEKRTFQTQLHVLHYDSDASHKIECN